LTHSLASRRGFLAALTAAPVWARGPARLEGTFLQLTGALARWDSAQWDEAFACFRRLGLKEYIIQWSAGPDQEFLSAVRMIGDHAAASRSRLWAGLYFDEEYWRRVEGPDSGLSAYLDEVAARSAALAAKLRQAVKLHGWYIPQEIDDLNWRTPARRAMLLAFLRRVSPKGRVAISGFRGGSLPVDEFVELWRSIARETPVKTLFLQDGVGTGKATVEQASALRTRLARSRIKVRAVVELFEQTSQAGAPFSAKPAPPDRIERQLGNAGKGAIAFSVPEYMTPLGGPAAARLYEAAISVRR